ncbi:MAG: putative nicotinate-nucleotide pyrophosphorylase, partial [Cyanobacteriota bacterium]
RAMPAASLPITPVLAAQLAAWLAEDIGRGDLTAPALGGRSGRAQWIAKAAGVFCGGVLVEPLFRQLDPAVGVRLLVADGEAVQPGQCLLELEGAAAALVAGERTALNLAMRLSGIATATAGSSCRNSGSTSTPPQNTPAALAIHWARPLRPTRAGAVRSPRPMSSASQAAS